MPLNFNQGYINPNQSVSIAISQTDSAEVNTGGMTLCGIFIPAALTGTSLSFLASTQTGGTFIPVYNSAGLVTYTVASSRYIAIDPKDFQGIQFLKIKSNATEAAARTLIISLKGL